MSIRSENQVWADLKGFIQHALKSFGIEGWQVRQLQQPLKLTTLEPTIFMARLRSPRIGWQYTKNAYVKNELIHTEKYKQEMRFQISALKKRKPVDINEATVSDVLNLLVSWFMSADGLAAIRAKGYNTYRISQLEEPFFIDDSDTYERDPYFELSLILNQSYSGVIPGTDKITVKTKGV